MTASLYTPELFAEICGLIRRGIPLAEVCRTEGFPCADTVRAWIRADKTLEPQYLQAREDGHDAIAADALRIIDTPEMGVIEKYERLPKPRPPGADPDTPIEYELVCTERRQEDMLGHRRLKFEGRLKLLAKWNPRYSDKVQVSGDEALPLTIVIKKLTDAGG